MHDWRGIYKNAQLFIYNANILTYMPGIKRFKHENQIYVYHVYAHTCYALRHFISDMVETGLSHLTSSQIRAL